MSFIHKIILEYRIQYIIDTISPVFLVIILGAVLQLSGFFKEGFAASLNKLVYWIALPILLFYNIAVAKYGYGEAMGVVYVVIAVMLAAILLSLLFSALFRLSGENTGAFVQGSYRGNLVFIGLPLIIYSAGSAAGKFEEISILAISLIIPIYNIAAIIILLASRHSFDKRMPLRVLKELFTNPLVISSVIGILYMHFCNRMPLFVERSCQTVGRIALPLSLLCIGASLAGTRNTADYSLSIVSAVIKVAFCPFVAFLAARWLGLTPEQTRVAIIFSACPTAVSSYVMASQLGANARLSAAIIMASSILSVAAFIAILIVI